MDIVTDSSVSSESVKDGEERQRARKKAKKLRARMNSRFISVSCFSDRQFDIMSIQFVHKEGSNTDQSN